MARKIKLCAKKINKCTVSPCPQIHLRANRPDPPLPRVDNEWSSPRRSSMLWLRGFMPEEAKELPGEYQLVGPSDDGGINDILATLSGKDSRQRLQALIAEWLRMENLVVLTGA